MNDVKKIEDFYEEGEALLLDDCIVDIDEDPYANIPECIHTLTATDDCNPFELNCNAHCNGGGICLLNPLSECYNMSLEDYRCYLDEMKAMETGLNEFLDSEEGQLILQEMREAYEMFEREDRTPAEVRRNGKNEG